jgi:hypothetical protein
MRVWHSFEVCELEGLEETRTCFATLRNSARVFSTLVRSEMRMTLRAKLVELL